MHFAHRMLIIGMILVYGWFLLKSDSLNNIVFTFFNVWFIVAIFANLLDSLIKAIKEKTNETEKS